MPDIPQCPRRCSDCAESKHHWMELFIDPEWDPDCEPQHAKAAEIIADWQAWVKSDPDGSPLTPIVWGCKHCEFWMRYLASCDVCDGPADDQLRCLSWREHHGEILEAEAEEE
jgi:hypothetical protein